MSSKSKVVQAVEAVIEAKEKEQKRRRFRESLAKNYEARREEMINRHALELSRLTAEHEEDVIKAQDEVTSAEMLIRQRSTDLSTRLRNKDQTGDGAVTVVACTAYGSFLVTRVNDSHVSLKPVAIEGA